MKRGAILVVLAVVVLFAAAATRATWAGHAALDDGDAALRRGDSVDAIAHYQRAARWYVPLVGATETALARLERLAGEAEQAGDRGTAQAAWTAVRSATIAIRGATAPFDDARARADQHLAALLATATNPAAGDTVEARTAWHARVLAAGARPARPSLWLAVAGLIILLVGGIEAMRAYPARLRRGLLIFASGSALWLLGLLLA